MIEHPKISIYPIKYLADKDGFVSKPHSHRHYEIFYFDKGEATHIIDFVEYLITDNSFFLVSYNQIHFITAEPNTFNSGFAITFDTDYFNFLDKELQILFGSFSKNPAYQSVDNNELVLIMFKQVEDELKKYEAKSGKLILYFVKIILTLVSRLHVNKPEEIPVPIKNQLWNNFLQALETNFIGMRSVSAYAKLLNTTPIQINRICKKHQNVSALSVIHNRINLEAKRKLFYTDNLIKDICFNLSFEDISHFNNFFKRMNNQTPNEFRKSMSQIFS